MFGTAAGLLRPRPSAPPPPRGAGCAEVIERRDLPEPALEARQLS